MTLAALTGYGVGLDKDEAVAGDDDVIIYKIVTAEQWAKAEKDGLFKGAPVDLADGYIHFSTADQVKETAARHFAGQQDLLLVSVSSSAIAADLAYEPSRGGQLFPTSMVIFRYPR